MPTVDLASDDGLRSALQHAIARLPEKQEWVNQLAETIQRVRSSGEAERSRRDFQVWLWYRQGHIPVDTALDDPQFRSWFAARSMAPLPASDGERRVFLSHLYQDLLERTKPFVRTQPHLKVFRVIAALYPEAMTTIASIGQLGTLSRAMGGDRTLDLAARHVWVRQRVDLLLGETDGSPLALAGRIVLPWILYDQFLAPPQADRTEKETGPAVSVLVPIPAALRRRGLTAVKGHFQGLLFALKCIQDGVTRDELLDDLRSEYPHVKESSLRTMMNSYKSEFGAIRFEGDRCFLTERGESLLESQDSGDIADWLLTRILGIDNVLVALQKNGSMPGAELITLLRQVNPGLTSNFGPSGLLSALISMGVLRADGAMRSLTEEGKEWAARIHWQPESLPADPEMEPAPVAGSTEEPPSGGENFLPPLNDIVTSIQSAGRFDRSLIERLHFSLWAQPVRHFAILTGLSGSGKTLLARRYAQALAATGSAKQVFTLPVQPGWYDPGALLGFTNPLNSDSYVRTPFLEFLIAASGDPARPYIAILDEMNLSHPEQYMAPLLSAMETGDAIQLHTEVEFFDGVPRELPYPRNLALIGTVNMDETTHGLSDKVLDRAFVHDFWDIDLNAYPRWGKRQIPPANEAMAREVLTSLVAALSPARLHFGWRVVDDILNFLDRAATGGGQLPFESALDSAIYAKILPKLRGEDSPRLRTAFQKCETALNAAGLGDSAAKIAELRHDLETTGSARFWR